MIASDLSRVVWRKSSRSGSGPDCVEVAFGGTNEELAVALRDSKNPAGPVLTVPVPHWTRFLSAL